MKLTNCEQVREYLLTAGWDADARQHAAQILAHAEGCAECRSALGDFDRIRQTLSPIDPAEASVPADGWEAMQGRFEHLLESQSSMRIAPASAARAGADRPPVVRPSLAIAAALIAVAAATFQVSRYFTPAPVVPTTVAVPVFLADPQRAEPAPARITDGDLVREVEQFRKWPSGPTGRPGWMLIPIDTREPRVGMVPSAATPSERLLLLRLSLWHGRDLVSRPDLLLVAGQTADVAVPVQSGQTLHYHIGTSADRGADDAANLYVWLELKTPAGSPLGAMVTNLHIHPNEVLTAGKLTTTVGEFELRLELKDAGMVEERR